MRLICSYCQAEMGDKEPLDDGRISHGMCDGCFEHFSKQWGGQTLGEYLDQFSFPVMVVSGERRVLAANQTMADMLGKSERDMFGLLGGEAIDCVNSRNPGGCGADIHCHTCTIRLAVVDTWDTGRPYVQVPASLTAGGGPIRFLVSTEKRDDTVVIKLEDVTEDDSTN